MDRSIWLNWKIRKPCPSCNSGYLNPPIDKQCLISETNESKKLNQEVDGYPVTHNIFSGHLYCSHCKDVVAVSGLYISQDYPSEEGAPLIREFTPLFLHPAPKIISIPKSCPDNIKNLLSESFSLFWIDKNSCANKIRVIIEALMDSLKVKKRDIKKNKRINLTLHKRILEFRKKNQLVADYILAIKWIGNEGSHFSNISENVLLDAYELLEYSLDQLFPDRKKRLDTISKKINKKKKPLS